MNKGSKIDMASNAARCGLGLGPLFSTFSALVSLMLLFESDSIYSFAASNVL